MSGMDYIKCENCAERLMFIGEHEHITIYCKTCYKELQAEIEKLKEVIEGYASHRPNCKVNCAEDLSGVCDCGLVRAVKESEVTE